MPAHLKDLHAAFVSAAEELKRAESHAREVEAVATRARQDALQAEIRYRHARRRYEQALLEGLTLPDLK